MKTLLQGYYGSNYQNKTPSTTTNGEKPLRFC